MTIEKIPLSDTDKKLLKRVFKIRIIIGAIFLPALLFAVGVMLYSAIHDLIDGSYDGMSFFGIGLTLIVFFLMYKYIIPFYKKSFKNTRTQNKLVVKTRITEIKNKFNNGMVKYTVFTDYMTIYSWSVSVLQLKLMYPDMYVNTIIELHLLEGNRTDILYLGKG